MAWRAPRYCYLHAARDAGASGLSITGTSTEAAGFPLVRIIDERRSVNFKFGESAANHHIQIDRGAGTPASIDRLYIPTGHNFSATTDLRLRTATDAAITTSVETRIDHTVAYGTSGGGMDVGTGNIDISFTSDSQRYVRLDWPSQTDQWELPELWLTSTVTITRGPEPRWTDQRRHNAVALPKASGEFPVIETGASQREFRLQYAQTVTTDTAALDALIAAVGISKPFILDPPYDDESAVVVKLIGAVTSTWDHPVPALGVKSKRYELSMLEALE